MNKIFMINLFFAIAGTLIGALIGSVFPRGEQKQIGYLLGFTAGIMLGLVCIDILPVLLTNFLLLKIIIFVVIGTLITSILDYKINHRFNHQTEQVDSLKSTAFLMFVGLCLHNIPEGIALVSSSLYNYKMGIRMGIVMMLHDIPEGLAISAPLSASGTKKYQAFLISTLSSVFTIIGLGIGFVAYKIMNELIYVSLAIASGSIIYIICKDLIPRALLYTNDEQLTLTIILGIIISLIIISL